VEVHFCIEMFAASEGTAAGAAGLLKLFVRDVAKRLSCAEWADSGAVLGPGFDPALNDAFFSNVLYVGALFVMFEGGRFSELPSGTTRTTLCESIELAKALLCIMCVSLENTDNPELLRDLYGMSEVAAARSSSRFAMFSRLSKLTLPPATLCLSLVNRAIAVLAVKRLRGRDT
jgi:hypothetical protein